MRITDKVLQAVIDRKPQAGCYHLHDIFGGHGTKRELYTQMQAWLRGYETAGE